VWSRLFSLESSNRRTQNALFPLKAIYLNRHRFVITVRWRLRTDTLLMQVGTLVLGSVGIWVALLNQRRQLNAQMFIEISSRFQEILRLFPTEAWLANLNPSRPMPPSSQELTDCTLYCIQLVADVYHLHKGGYISKHLWVLWEREIKRTLTGPVFLREWGGVAAEFAHDQDFIDYICTMMNCKGPVALSAIS